MQRRWALRSIFFASFLFFAHLSVVMYINSTVLGQLLSATMVSVCYVLGAAGSIILFFVLPIIVRRVGLVKTAVSIFLLLALALFSLSHTTTALFVVLFVLYTALTSTVWYCNDLFVAHYSHHRTAGHIRGGYLTLNNTAIAIMPVVAGFAVERHGLHSVYSIGAMLLLLAACIILYSQRKFSDKIYHSTTIPAAWEIVRHSPSLRRVTAINFLLQFFYVWMTIFAPLYLSLILHFSWEAIGIMFSCMLTAFILLQYPIGRLADHIGEKMLLIVGFSIATISTLAFAVLEKGPHSIVMYGLILFCTRVGICMVEVLSETYFFKQITDQDEGVISIYRMMTPIAYILGPLIGWYIIAKSSYSFLFICLSFVLLFGTIYTLRLKEVR